MNSVSEGAVLGVLPPSRERAFPAAPSPPPPAAEGLAALEREAERVRNAAQKHVREYAHYEQLKEAERVRQAAHEDTEYSYYQEFKEAERVRKETQEDTENAHYQHMNVEVDTLESRQELLRQRRNALLAMERKEQVRVRVHILYG